MQGRTAIGAGRISESGIGDTVREVGRAIGASAVRLTIPEIPDHSHHVKATTGGHIPAGLGGGRTLPETYGGLHVHELDIESLGVTSNPNRSGDLHPNMQPSLVLSYIIKF